MLLLLLLLLLALLLLTLLLLLLLLLLPSLLVLTLPPPAVVLTGYEDAEETEIFHCFVCLRTTLLVLVIFTFSVAFTYVSRTAVARTHSSR